MNRVKRLSIEFIAGICSVLIILSAFSFSYAADTWQLYGAVSYRFGWGDIRFGYRHLGYDLGDDKIMKDLKLSGPILGLGFRF